MKQRKLVIIALSLGMMLAAGVASQAQDQMQAGGQAQKLAALAKQLNLSPEQKMQLMPILKEEAPKVEAIKSNTSLTGMQKMEQLRALHEQTNPEVQKILSPQQYQQLQQIRQQEIEQAMRKRANPM
jgi:outer membrane murein-binding lipoprotein Lpp